MLEKHFCSNCGYKLPEEGKFCPSCGKMVDVTPDISQSTNKRIIRIEQNTETKLVPAKCTQCGANLEVDPTQEAAACKFCNTPFIVSKAIYNYNLSASRDVNIENIGNIDNVTIVAKVDDSQMLKIMAGNQSLQKFITAYDEYEKKTKQELIPETVKRLFGGSRPGTEKDIDYVKFASLMGKFIKQYNVPHDEASIIEFYAYMHEKAFEDIDEENLDGNQCEYYEELKEAWGNKANQILETAKMLYPNNAALKKLNPRRKFDDKTLSMLMNGVTASDVIRTVDIITRIIKH